MQAKTISKHNLAEQYLKKENQYIAQNMNLTPTAGARSLHVQKNIEKNRLLMNNNRTGHGGN